jgi:hypothetical protein
MRGSTYSCSKRGLARSDPPALSLEMVAHLSAFRKHRSCNIREGYRVPASIRRFPFLGSWLAVLAKDSSGLVSRASLSWPKALAAVEILCMLRLPSSKTRKERCAPAVSWTSDSS